MSQTCVMLTVLAPKPNPWRCSLQLAEQWPWPKFAHGHESGCSAAGSSSNAIRTRENNRAIFDHAANHHRRELTRPSTLKPLLTAVAK
jgi:hypothetical protein